MSGVVRDSSGAAVQGADVEIRNAGGTLLAVRKTDPAGKFEWAGEHEVSGYFQFRVNSRGLETRELFLRVTSPEVIEITLQPPSIFTRLVVSATRGAAEEASSSPHVAVILDAGEMREHPLATIGNGLEQQPGILVQQSTYGQVSPFLRGLTGYQVLNVVDGIRFNNSTFRSGPNQYLAFVEPTQAQRVEALLGPTGSQYGSDSLGGTIQVVTPEARFADQGGSQVRGEITLSGASADFSGAGSARISIANEKLFWLGGASGRRHNDLRGGHGYDSRNVYHRLFGLSLQDVKELTGSRQQDSGFQQYGVQTKFSARLSAEDTLTIHYQRGQQDGVRGYKDLLGGLGRLVSAFEPQVLNWFYGRYEKIGLGVFDSVSGTFSLNSQSDGSVRQNLQFTDPITRDLSRVDAYGYTGQATSHWGQRLYSSFGGEIYDERIASEREVRNPLSGVTRPRPLYPDGAQYQNFGLFGQASYDATRALRIAGGLRLTNVRFKTQATPAFGIPEASQWFRDVTFNSSVRWQMNSVLSVHGVVSRGFRAPNLNDLGALGLNDLGYEIPSSDAIQAKALLSTDAGETAVSKSEPLKPLAAESLMNYEFGVHATARRFSARTQFFDAELYDPIVRRTLLFPAASAPSQLAGLPVTVLPQTAAQQAQGVVAVATQMDPRAVKSFVNDGRSRYYGLETLAHYTINSQWSLDANYSYILGRDLNPNRNIRRLPPQMGTATLRYTPSPSRPWIEVSMTGAGAQSRLSGGDRDDERIGASFRRRDIADFFNGGRVAPYLTNGVFSPTGETLRQIQDRVLPVGAVINGLLVVDDNSRVPLYLSTAGWATISVRSGMRLGERWQVMGAVENLLDRNYRFHGSGVDAPGAAAYLSLSYRF